MIKPVFNKRVAMTVVLVAHVVILILFSIFALATPEVALTHVTYMKPVQTGYDNLRLDWIGYGRDVAHGTVIIGGAIVGYMMIRFGSQLRNEVSQFFLTMIGVQVMFGAFLNMTLFGLVVWGGFWHLLSLMVVGCEAASVTITTFVMMLYWKSFVNLGNKQDALVSSTEGTS